MQQTLAEPLEAALLTGAGFTKNFGGFLSDDMRAFIVSRIQDHPVLMRLLNDPQLDYESAYVEVMHGDYCQKDKSALAEAVFYAYKKLDDVVRKISWTQAAPHGLNLYGLKKLLNRFDSTVNGKRGYFFTLNQDLFVERWYGQETLLKIPGSLNLPDIHHHPSRPLESGDYLCVPKLHEIEKLRVEDSRKTSSSGRYHYLKLHGSFNWVTPNGLSDGSSRRVMVIGGKKWEQIQNEPILHYYYERFCEVLRCPNRRLCVIGYSFRDEHINNVIREALTCSGLKLFIISPKNFANLAQEIETNDPNNGSVIRARMRHWPWALKTIYPSDQSRTVHADEIENALFDHSP